MFRLFDPSSTGSHILAWTEWQYFQLTEDTERLKAVFPMLVAYHRWCKAWRTCQFPPDSHELTL
ncbi:MAG: hypothetical protein IAE80_08175 [Anaerolinea sp.]|nr:hypothetical protein [Anaerolinea sp.]